MFRRTLFSLTALHDPDSRFFMNAVKARWCWRKDLSEFRGMSERDRAGFLVLLEWFENFRMRYDLHADREAARIFWKAEVKREGREREPWQLAQWEDAAGV